MRSKFHVSELEDVVWRNRLDRYDIQGLHESLLYIEEKMKKLDNCIKELDILLGKKKELLGDKEDIEYMGRKLEKYISMYPRARYLETSHKFVMRHTGVYKEVLGNHLEVMEEIVPGERVDLICMRRDLDSLKGTIEHLVEEGNGAEVKEDVKPYSGPGRNKLYERMLKNRKDE